MTSVADYLRALYARAAELHCRGCGQPVSARSPASIFERCWRRAAGRAALISLPAPAWRKVAGLGRARGCSRRPGFRRVLEDGRARALEDAR